MAAVEPPATELTVTLRISSQARDRLARRATESGQDLADCIARIVEQSVSPMHSLEDISGPVREQFQQSGMTEDELSELLEDAKHRRRAERRTEHIS